MGSRTEPTFEGQLILEMPTGSLSEEGFYEFCRLNRDLRIERNAEGHILIIPPTTSDSGNFNAEFSAELALWNRQDRLGLVFDSSTGFTLPNSAVYSPDAAWIIRNRWEALSQSDRQKFAPIAPDFVAEIRSQSDTMKSLKKKMEEYRANGVRLGWLIDPEERVTFVYDANTDVRTVAFEEPLTGEDVLPGFEVILSKLVS